MGVDLSKIGVPWVGDLAIGATPKHKMTTRLDVKDAKDTDDNRRLTKWRAEVRERDKGRCRVCGVKTEKTTDFVTKRGEAHHITSRKDKAVRYDRRNGLHTCLQCHQRFTTGKLFVLATARQMFKAENGKAYIDGDNLKLRFEVQK